MGYMKDQDLALAERLISAMTDVLNKWEFGDITGFEMHQALLNAVNNDPVNELMKGK